MKKRKKSFPKITVLLLAASAVLLVGSGVGSARAALTYYSENYSADEYAEYRCISGRK